MNYLEELTMKCDYNEITLYEAGEFNKRYKTDVWDKIRILPFAEIENKVVRESFLNSEYIYVETLEPIVLYRTFGWYGRNGANANGAYASTEFAESVIDVKIRLALLPRWGNTKMYEAKFIVPIGEKFHIGIAAPQFTKSGTRLNGGAEQIFIPNAREKWNDWVCGYRRITSRQLDAPPEFPLQAVKEKVEMHELYELMCPKCTCAQIERLARVNSDSDVNGSEKMLYRCCNPECGYIW